MAADEGEMENKLEENVAMEGRFRMYVVSSALVIAEKKVEGSTTRSD